jgi:hypothetical protein
MPGFDEGHRIAELEGLELVLMQALAGCKWTRSGG